MTTVSPQPGFNTQGPILDASNAVTDFVRNTMGLPPVPRSFTVPTARQKTSRPSKGTKGFTLSRDALSAYGAPYESWERDLVAFLDGQPRSPIKQDVNFGTQYKPNECHHNIVEFCKQNKRASPVYGWIDVGNGYVSHSVVDIDGELIDVTPRRIKCDAPFVRDNFLRISWSKRRNGMTRVKFTREGRTMPLYGLRTEQLIEEARSYYGLLR